MNVIEATHMIDNMNFVLFAHPSLIIYNLIYCFWFKWTSIYIFSPSECLKRSSFKLTKLCENQHHKSHHTSNLNYMRFPSYLLFTFLLYFLFIFYLPRCTQPDFPSVFSLASLPFLPCCHRVMKTLQSLGAEEEFKFCLEIMHP